MPPRAATHSRHPTQRREKVTAAGACDGAPASHPAALNFGGPVPMEAGSRISEPRGTRLRLVGRSSPPPVKICSGRSHRNLPAAVGCCLGAASGAASGRLSVVFFAEGGSGLRGCRSRHGLLDPPPRRARPMGPRCSINKALFVRLRSCPRSGQKVSTSAHVHSVFSGPSRWAGVVHVCDGSHSFSRGRAPEGPTFAHGFLCGIAR